MRTDYEDPVRWSPVGVPETDAARLGLIHAEALLEDLERDRELARQSAEVQGYPIAQGDGDPGPREGWDLLLDYDRDSDVPGMVPPHGPFWAQSGETGDRPVRVLEVEDGPPDPKKLRGILAHRLERSGHTITGWEWSRSTNGWHLKLRTDPRPVNPIEAVALQAILGSDPLRESCNLQRAREVEHMARAAEDGTAPDGAAAAAFWRDRWNVLYRPNPSRRKVGP